MTDIRFLVKKYFEEYGKRNQRRDKLYKQTCDIKEIQKEIHSLLDAYQYARIKKNLSEDDSTDEN